MYIYIYIQTAYMNYTNSHKDPWEDWYIFTQHMVNFPIGFVGFHPVTQVTLYHLDLSYNNLGSTSCQAVLVFFFWCYGKRQVFFGCFIMIVTKIATSSLWIDVCVYVDTQKGYIYICTYLQVCIIKDPSHQKVIWQSRKACNLFLFSLGEFWRWGVDKTVGGIWWIWTILHLKFTEQWTSSPFLFLKGSCLTV